MTILSVQRTGKASRGRSQPQSRVGKSSTFLILPTREGPGYATEASSLSSK